MEQSYAGQKSENLQDVSNILNVKQSHIGLEDVNNITFCINPKITDANKKTKTCKGLKVKDGENVKNADHCIDQKVNNAKTV